MIERMTAEEIRIMYRDAKDKPKQITILADMNLCRQADIKAILDGKTDELPPPRDNVRHESRHYTTEQEKREIIRLHGNGLTPKEISAATGRCEPTIKKIIKACKEDRMTFTEEQTPQQNEQLLQEITEKIADKPQSEIPSIPTENFGVAEIAGTLMDFVTLGLGTYVVEIKRGKDGYTVRVENETEGVVLTRRTSHEP
ncbi:MAG: helix-turn-helix domain-containing protein [Oscillospiraceae bacterium]